MEPTARDWPVLMDLTTAGEYLALSPSSLINLLRREHVSPVDVGARLRRWRRQDLDALVARLPRSWEPVETEDEAAAAAAALAAVERRAQARRRLVSARRSREVRQSHPAA